MRKLIVLISLLFIYCDFQSQVLTVDRENGEDSIAKRIHFTWSTGLSLDKQKSNLIEIESAESKQ
jgi:hypothetical protein